jgi:hypothetical protein
VLGFEPGALHMLGKHSTPEPQVPSSIVPLMTLHPLLGTPTPVSILECITLTLILLIPPE